MKTFELVLGGHPDKVCDIIAENIKEKVEGKSAVEVAWFNNKIIVGGEVSEVLNDLVVKEIVQETLHELGYFENILVENLLQTQSQEIADIVKDVGAGDNGIFFAGYSSVWSPIVEKLKKVSQLLTRQALNYNYRTDGKFIATFNGNGELLKFTINIASSENQTLHNKELFAEYLSAVLDLTFDFSEDYDLEINPKGDWFKCGGFADAGLTGRKLACDNTCGLFKQGGGAFFGKDVSKADYSVPLYLYHKAKEYIKGGNLLGEIELKAHTIIGDEKVEIYTIYGEHLETIEFTEIMKFATKNKMSWVGL